MKTLLYNEPAYAALDSLLGRDKFPHSLLVEAPEGCGGFAFALAAAQGVLCSGEKRPCGKCRHCAKAESGIHPDLGIYRGEGGEKSFHIDTVRKLRREAGLSPVEAPRKVLLLRGVEDLSIQAQNALLKILEEPSPTTYFILTCRNRRLLLETVLSRLTVISLQIPTVEQCARALPELAKGFSPALYHRAACLAQGSIGRALEALCSPEMPAAYETGVDILCALCSAGELSALEAFARFEKDREGFRELLDVLKETVLTLLGGNPEADPRLERITGRATRQQLIGIADCVDDIAQGLSQNVGIPLLATALCAKVRLRLEDAASRSCPGGAL